MNKEKVELSLTYWYKGASCYSVIIVQEDGWIDIYNSWNEKMYSCGSADQVAMFITELSEGKYVL